MWILSKKKKNEAGRLLTVTFQAIIGLFIQRLLKPINVHNRDISTAATDMSGKCRILLAEDNRAVFTVSPSQSRDRQFPATREKKKKKTRGSLCDVCVCVCALFHLE